MNKSNNHTNTYLEGIGHRGTSEVIADLSMNENPLGPPLSARIAYREAEFSLERYPDGSQSVLKNALGQKYGIEPDQIACGAGIDELITLITRVSAGPGDEIVFPRFSFLMFAINAVRAGATPVEAGNYIYQPEPDEIVSCITEKTRLIFVASPNNPTGSYLLRPQVEWLLQSVSSHIPIVLDAAYSEYVVDGNYTDGLDLIDKHPNLLVMRSFSKIYGLASLRVGWCVGSKELIRKIEQMRGPYNVSGPSLAAAAAAITDDDHVRHSRKHTHDWLDYFKVGIEKARLQYVPSGANFILIQFRSAETASDAYTLFRKLGILTRPLRDYGLTDCLRISVGSAEENSRFIECLEEFSGRFE